MKTYFIAFLLMITAISYAHDGENFVASDMLKSMQPATKPPLSWSTSGPRTTTPELSPSML